MKMTTERDDAFFDDLMGQAAQERLAPSDALLDRIMLDADAVLAEAAVAPVVSDLPRRSLGAVIVAALGGWSAISGLAAAGVAGVWIGVAPPEALSDITQTVWGGDTVEIPLLETDTYFGLEG